MFERVARFFSPPPGGKGAGAIRTRLLSRSLNLYLLVALSLGFYLRGSSSTRDAAAALSFAQIPLTLAMRLLMHRGRARVASWLFLVGLSTTVPLVAYFASSSAALAPVGLFQMLVIVMSGLLLGGPEALAFSVLIVLTNGALFLEEALRRPDRVVALESTWILEAVFYMTTAMLLSKSIRLSEEAMTLAEREAAERRAAEEALRQNMERYRLITSVSSDYVFSNVLEEGKDLRLDWVAGAFENITGYTYEEFVARGGWQAALFSKDREQDALELATLKQNRRVTSEVRIVHKDGTPRWVRVYAHPLWDEKADRLCGIYGAVQDIDARKQAELEREELIVELEARNGELERFTYTVSHDLKSPLITIRGFLGHIEQAAIEGRLDDLKSDMQRVFKSTSKMHQLLDDLLDLSRIGRLAKAPEEVPFDAIVRDALDRSHGRLIAAKAAVEVEGTLGIVRVDRDRLVEVMQNLIDNAAKFMGDQKDPHIWIGVRDLGAGKAYFVRDNGVGIETRHHEHVFNLFDKLDPKTQGTGVGLALVKRIIEVHGGRVWVESEGQNKGATVLFTLNAP